MIGALFAEMLLLFRITFKLWLPNAAVALLAAVHAVWNSSRALPIELGFFSHLSLEWVARTPTLRQKPLFDYAVYSHWCGLWWMQRR